MGILDRVSTLMRANINDLIDRAEDPEKVVRQLIVDMIPQLALIIGPQSPVPDLPPTQAQQRFHQVFQKFTSTILPR